MYVLSMCWSIAFEIVATAELWELVVVVEARVVAVVRRVCRIAVASSMADV